MKKLSFDEIKEVTLGAVRFEEKSGALFFRRFTEAQSEVYRITAFEEMNGSTDKSVATAGVKLAFITNSEKLFLKINAKKALSRTYFAFDIYSQGKHCGSLSNYTDEDTKSNYVRAEFPLGTFEGEFSLGEGKKEVSVYFPWSVEASLIEAALDDNAWVKPIKYPKKIICYGDSITQGYDSLHPAMRYASRLAEALFSEEVNKAIGGEVFYPRLATLRDDFTPRCITVAYGTNDWCNTKKDEFFDNCRSFYKALSENYPTVPIFAISPIWRKDNGMKTRYGEFSHIELAIKEAVSDIENVHFISGFGFVPQDEALFADKVLHPNDDGFEFYFKNLFNKIKKRI